MSSFRSIRFRLTAWYFASIILLLALLGHGSWHAARLSMQQAIDEGLVQRMDGVVEALRQYSNLDESELVKRLAESSNLTVGGGLFRVFDSSNRLIYQSGGFSRYHISIGRPPVNGQDILFRSTDQGDFLFNILFHSNDHGDWLRFAAKRFDFRGEPWIVEVAEPLNAFKRALQRLHAMVLIALPPLAILATLVGFWISTRALAPVDRITAAGREISASNLSERLPVPNTHDELQRLSETLNGMLDRIEGSFDRNRQFTADASHELRAPLTLIHSAAEFALRRERSREELLESLRQILRESKRTTQLLNKLLTLARSDANVKPFESSRVNFTGIVADLRSQVESLAGTAQQKVSFYLPPEALDVMGEDASLRQLCLILVDNASKYTPAGGSISVSLAQESGAAVLTVRDTGVGISEEQLPHIFDRFWRADKIRSRETGGAGLGLSIARVIADQHGAQIFAESKLGSGSTFTVRIPLISAQLKLPA